VSRPNVPSPEIRFSGFVSHRRADSADAPDKRMVFGGFVSIRTSRHELTGNSSQPASIILCSSVSQPNGSGFGKRRNASLVVARIHQHIACMLADARWIAVIL
jgi:hypothetical protein